jgi:hypothetical protein
MTFEQFFTPLGKEYCLYFYAGSVISFIIFLLMLIGSVGTLIVHRSKAGYGPYVMIIHSVTFGILYFNDRLLYSMCVN